MDALGIVIEKKEIKTALVRKLNKKFEIKSLRTLNENPDLEKNTPVVTGLNSSSFILREVSLKLKRKRSILSILPFQTESLIPYPPEETIIYPQIKKSDVCLFATTHTHLKSHLEECLSRGINPDQISCSAMALKRFAQKDSPHLFIFHEEEEKSTFVLVVEGKIVVSQTVAQKKELERILAFVQSKYPNVSFEIVLTGLCSEEVKRFFEAVGWQVRIPENAAFALPIGLALDALAQDGVQFRQKSYAHPNSTKKRMKHVLFALSFSLLFSALLFGMGTFFKMKREEELKKRLETYLSADVEAPLAQAVNAWEKELSEHKSSFPYFLTTYSVSDTLSWISAFPYDIDVKQMRYSLVKHPKVGGKLEPYVAKIELEFTASAPRHAREFHDALLKEDSFVNSKEEITWRAEQNLYRTSFFLKGRLS